MAEWQREHPGEHWEMAQAHAGDAEFNAAARRRSHPTGSAATSASAGTGRAGETVAAGPAGRHLRQLSTTRLQGLAGRDRKFVEEGKRIFHGAKLLGGTIGVSCDMCHPDASNTHPETYPKYQVQLQRVALLRDMIDWCIENPVKGKTMDPNDPRLRALEAYIFAQRKGVPLDYGKH